MTRTLSFNFLTGNLKPGFSPLSILLLIIVLLGSDSLTQSPLPLPSPRRYITSPSLQREVRLLGPPVSRAAASLHGSASTSASGPVAAHARGSYWRLHPLRWSTSTSRVTRLCAIEGSEGNGFVHYVLTLQTKLSLITGRSMV